MYVQLKGKSFKYIWYSYKWKKKKKNQFAFIKLQGIILFYEQYYLP